MTSFGEEFFGCRFHRDKLAKPSDAPSARDGPRVRSHPAMYQKQTCCIRQKPSTQDGETSAPTPPLMVTPCRQKPSTRDGQTPAPAPPKTPMPRLFPISEVAPTTARTMRLVQKIGQLSPNVALSVVGAVQPFILDLQACVASLQCDVAAAAHGPGQSAAGFDPAEVAQAVIAALSSRFEVLEKQAAAAAAASSQADFEICQKSQESVLKEMLPLIGGSLEASIVEALRTQLPDKGNQLYNSYTPASIQPSSIGFSDSGVSNETSNETDEHAARPSQLLRNMHGLTFASTLSTFGKLKRNTSRSQNKLPPRSFVVNFRRLVEIQKILAIIHEFIRSTAIAALTLVAAANWSQLAFSLFFVTLILALFAVHEIRHDGMDIEDYKSLIDLLEDDGGVCHGRTIHNPNRLLKGLAISHCKSRRRRAFLTISIALVLCLCVWINIFWSWATPPDDGIWLGLFDEEDRMMQASLLLVGTFMIAFHLAFEWLYWRETQCVLPPCPDGRVPLDPREDCDGIPRRYRWFGLPSMWFTSQQAYDDLRLWVTHSRNEDYGRAKLHPEEMALLALNPDGASYLRKTLGCAKLFDMGTWEFLTRDEQGRKPRSVRKGEDPEELSLDFVLFDNASDQFLQPEEDYRSGMMQLLTRSFSNRVTSPSNGQLN